MGGYIVSGGLGPPRPINRSAPVGRAVGLAAGHVLVSCRHSLPVVQKDVVHEPEHLQPLQPAVQKDVLVNPRRSNKWWRMMAPRRRAAQAAPGRAG